MVNSEASDLNGEDGSAYRHIGVWGEGGEREGSGRERGGGKREKERDGRGRRVTSREDERKRRIGGENDMTTDWNRARHLISFQ